MASFTNLTINKTGSGYTLRVSSSGLTSATSGPINVTASGQVTRQASVDHNATDLSLGPLVLDSPDPWDGSDIQEMTTVDSDRARATRSRKLGEPQVLTNQGQQPGPRYTQ